MAKKKLFRTSKNADATRKAKPLGYRYKNLDPTDSRYFKRPTAEEIEKFKAGDKKMKRIIAFEDRPERSDANQKNKLAKGGSLDIQFPNSNLYLVGKGYDKNGNYVVKVTFPNATAFSIQTGGTLKQTENNLKSVGKISELTEEQILEIEKEVVDYVSEHGSKLQKSKLKTYSGFDSSDIDDDDEDDEKTEEQYVEHLNEMGVPEHDHPENGGRVSWDYINYYGEWLQENDPIAFNVGYNEWKRGYKDGGEVTTKTKTISGVKHTIIRGKVDYNSMKTMEEFSHPLGTVYSDGKYGYVASGYDWLRFDIKDLDRIKSRMKDGGSVQRYTFGIEYKPTASSKIFRKTSLTMVGGDTEEMNDAITKNAEALKKQEGWHEIKVTKTPIMKDGGGAGELSDSSIALFESANFKLKNVSLKDYINLVKRESKKKEFSDSSDSEVGAVVLNKLIDNQLKNLSVGDNVIVRYSGAQGYGAYAVVRKVLTDSEARKNVTGDYVKFNKHYLLQLEDYYAFENTPLVMYNEDNINYYVSPSHLKEDNEARVNQITFTGKYARGGSFKRSKASINQDKNIKALHAGKRFSEDGNVYYENRINRSDVDRRLKLEKGGSIKKFSEQTNEWFDDLVDFTTEHRSNETLQQLIDISEKTASKENLEKFKTVLNSCECPKPSLKKALLEQIDNILDGQYKNEFKFSFGGNKSGYVKVGGAKVSATSEFFSMFNQASTYNDNSMKKGGDLWIQESIKKEGILRKKAKEMGLIHGDEKLSATDLDKLEALGGVWGYRARLARTLKKMEKGGEFTKGAEISTSKFASILGRTPRWNESEIKHDGTTFEKCFLKQYWKVV